MPHHNKTQQLLPCFVSVQQIDVGLMTPNLHDLACQLHIQERELGDVVHSLELWVERYIQLVKRTVQYRTTRYPEQVVANEELLRRALAIAKLYSQRPLLTVAEIKAASTKEKVEQGSALSLDPLQGALGASAMRDHGLRPSEADWDINLKPALLTMLIDNPAMVSSAALSYLQNTHYSQLHICVHREVTIRGDLVISSATLLRQTVCESYWVLTEYLDDDEGKYYTPGKVERYVRVRLPDTESGEQCFLRAALCTFWQPLETWEDRDIGGPVYRFWHDPSCITHKGFAVPLECITSPLLRTHESLPVIINRVQKRCDHYLLTAYSFLSGVKH